MIRNLTISASDYDEMLFAVHTVRAVEWQGRRALGGLPGPFCPACRNAKIAGHAPDCEVAHVIAADDRREAGEVAA